MIIALSPIWDLGPAHRTLAALKFYLFHLVLGVILATALSLLAYEFGQEAGDIVLFVCIDLAYPIFLTVLAVRAKRLPKEGYFSVLLGLLLVLVMGFVTALLIPTALTMMKRHEPA